MHIYTHTYVDTYICMHVYVYILYICVYIWDKTTRPFGTTFVGIIQRKISSSFLHLAVFKNIIVKTLFFKPQICI